MHPAGSIIFFTTASGLGYGLLTWAGVLTAFGLLPADRGLGLAVCGLGLALVGAGLLSSLLHLGHPERAWRALSQWRSSWLSREGVSAILAFVPAGLFAFGWVVLQSIWPLAGLLTAVMAVVTVYCTAMIYRSLVPIRQWSNRTTVPAYLGLALMTGAMWLYALVLAFGVGGRATLLVLGGAALLSIPATYMIKRAAWRTGTMPAGVSVQSATSLNGREVRSVEWPHTEENYLLKEMGYRIARKHAARLRLIATAAGFIIPLVLLALTLGHTNGWAVTAACAAALSMAVGVAVERWLFFAEAKHTVTLYYGR